VIADAFGADPPTPSNFVGSPIDLTGVLLPPPTSSPLKDL
jgi:hypothetical protein